MTCAECARRSAEVTALKEEATELAHERAGFLKRAMDAEAAVRGLTAQKDGVTRALSQVMSELTEARAEVAALKAERDMFKEASRKKAGWLLEERQKSRDARRLALEEAARVAETFRPDVDETPRGLRWWMAELAKKVRALAATPAEPCKHTHLNPVTGQCAHCGWNPASVVAPAPAEPRATVPLNLRFKNVGQVGNDVETTVDIPAPDTGKGEGDV